MVPIFVSAGEAIAPTYALFDSGASCSAINSELANRNSSPVIKLNDRLGTFNSESVAEREVTSFMPNNLNEDFNIQVSNALVANILSTENEVPPCNRQLKNYTHLANLLFNQLEGPTVDIISNIKFEMTEWQSNYQEVTADELSLPSLSQASDQAQGGRVTAAESTPPVNATAEEQENCDEFFVARAVDNLSTAGDGPDRCHSVEIAGGGEASHYGQEEPKKEDPQMLAEIVNLAKDGVKDTPFIKIGKKDLKEVKPDLKEVKTDLCSWVSCCPDPPRVGQSFTLRIKLMPHQANECEIGWKDKIPLENSHGFSKVKNATIEPTNISKSSQTSCLSLKNALANLSPLCDTSATGPKMVAYVRHFLQGGGTHTNFTKITLKNVCRFPGETFTNIHLLSDSLTEKFSVSLPLKNPLPASKLGPEKIVKFTRTGNLTLSHEKAVPKELGNKTSRLTNLSHLIDKANLLRAGGRIGKPEKTSYGKKHPSPSGAKPKKHPSPSGAKPKKLLAQMGLTGSLFSFAVTAATSA